MGKSFSVKDMLWGKLRFDESGRLLCAHPLLAHLADVAAVTEGLLALRGIRSRLEAAAGGPFDASLVHRFCVLAALHDIGKFTPGFQNKSDPSRRDVCGHVEVLRGLTYNGYQPFLAAFPWITGWDGSDGCVLLCFLDAVFSHHGRPGVFCSEAWSMAERQRIYQKYWTAEDGRALAELANLLPRLQKWFPLAFDSQAAALPHSSPLQHLFAGLVMLADWIASDEDLFPFCGERGRPGPEIDPMDYARQAAAGALVDTGLNARANLPRATLQFEDAFPFPPNQLQSAVGNLPLPETGSLAIIEAETGGGKTEAALWYFIRLFNAGLVDALYFANPLRFAATQLHGRVRDALARAFGPGKLPVTLAVPGYIRVDHAAGYRLPGFRVLWTDQGDPLLRRQGWASEHPKRFLAAPAAVGTIDQALLSGLRVPHAHLRMAALSRSLLVIDEAHASDVYMTELTLGVLDMFRRCGGHALIMSATLGGAARARYVQSMSSERWTKPRPPSLQACLAAEYPRITTLNHDEPIGAEASRPDKCVDVRIEPVQADAGAVARIAADLVRQGACVLVLRNTVRLAVDTARALEDNLGRDHPALFRAGGVPSLHHSRFAAEDRELLDARVVELHGKRNERDRANVRPPGVVASTQTLEQSLDVDFDAIVTDLAPMDVLLQRIGRVFRHPGARPHGFDRALCVVLTHEDPDFPVSRAAAAFNYGPDRAYEDPAMLEATRRLLAERAANDGLKIPSMNRKLVERSTHPEAIDRLADELGEAFSKAHATVRGAAIARAMLADGHRIDWSEPFGPEAAPMRDERDERRPKTRLGLDDRKAWLDEPIAGPFGQAVRDFVIPSSWLHEAGPDEPLLLINADEQGLVLEFAGARLRYDRFGLRKWEDEP